MKQFVWRDTKQKFKLKKTKAEVVASTPTCITQSSTFGKFRSAALLFGAVLGSLCFASATFYEATLLSHAFRNLLRLHSSLISVSVRSKLVYITGRYSDLTISAHLKMRRILITCPSHPNHFYTHLHNPNSLQPSNTNSFTPHLRTFPDISLCFRHYFCYFDHSLYAICHSL